jgi:hypothetical protein
VIGLLLVAAGFAAGCASAPPAAIRGDTLDLRALVGEWDGTYISRDGTRAGTIWFKLLAGDDHAHGDVVMHPRGGTPYVAYGLHDYPELRRARETPQLLMIRVVRVDGAELDGMLEAYWDPACGCLATTSFRGRLADNALNGTFVTVQAGVPVAEGQWTATRRR